MKLKRYAIVEIPDNFPRSYGVFDIPGWAHNIRFDILTGPVDLMQAACKEAGVKYTTPQKVIGLCIVT